MLSAAASESPEFIRSHKSSQQAEGKRGERPPSYREGRQTMNKKLAAAQPTMWPRANWFVAGALVSFFLIYYNGILMRMLDL